MAQAVDFDGSNKVIHAPPGREDVSDLHTFMNGAAIVSAWKLSVDELEEVNRTGRVFLSSLSGAVLYPVFVGSETEVRRMVADYGKVWVRDADRWPPEDWRCPECRCRTYAHIDEKQADGRYAPGPSIRCVHCKLVLDPPRPRHICANPLCAAVATHFPVIGFGPAGHSGPLPYKLESPKGLCVDCLPGFDPRVFFADEAKAGMTQMIVGNDLPAPDFDRIDLEWLPVDHPHFAEIAGGGEARLWFR